MMMMMMMAFFSFALFYCFFFLHPRPDSVSIFTPSSCNCAVYDNEYDPMTTSRLCDLYTYCMYIV